MWLIEVDCLACVGRWLPELSQPAEGSMDLDVSEYLTET
jgi:hypothetical protein